MLVSRNWLSEYVQLDMSLDDLIDRVTMAGLNHDGAEQVGEDIALNLEVTSNRPDCLGHLGVAREIAVLYGRPLTVPAAEPKTVATATNTVVKVRIDAPELCQRYTARVLRGVKIGPSPRWLVDRLRTIGVPAINNVVDVTNYVLFECGQPLHAFDLAKLAGQQIVVRSANAGETLAAINHKSYSLEAGMCVIADAQKPVALAGVMGGADTEVSSSTTDVLIESAEFDPMSVRATSRKLALRSDSSYRFERGLDPQGVDWASRRACELILQLAGGKLLEGVVDVGRPRQDRASVELRFARIERVLGIKVPADDTRRILASLGCVETIHTANSVSVVPPSWRRDLTREIDLIEEVARIHGYDKIPEDVSVPMAISYRTVEDRVLQKVRGALVGAGFDEALTLSVVEESLSELFSPWTDEPPLRSSIPVLRRADRLRRSLVPSLLAARRTNESLANPTIELFEIAKIYLPQSSAAGQANLLPREELTLALTSGGDFLAVKGVLEAVVNALDPAASLHVLPVALPLLDKARSCKLLLRTATGERPLGFLGEVSQAGLKQCELRASTTVAELQLSTLLDAAKLAPQFEPLPAFPAIERDLNLVVDEAEPWSILADTARQAAAPLLEALQFREVYRDAQKLGAGKKSLVFSLVLRSPQGTLTGEMADEACNRVVAAAAAKHGAELRK